LEVGKSSIKRLIYPQFCWEMIFQDITMTEPASDDAAKTAPAAPPVWTLHWSLEAPLPFSVLSLSQRLNVQARALLAGRCDLTLSEWRIVRVLGMGGIDGSTAVRKAAMIEESQFSRMLSPLVGRDVLTVAPHPEDRRQTRLTLTPAGRARHDRIAPVFDARNQALNAVLTEAQSALILGALRKLAVAAEEGRAPKAEG
jgi:DNA-binding MarR family transcriptional regulator